MARRSHSVLALVLLALAGAFSVPRASGIGSEGRILRVDPRFDELVPAEHLARRPSLEPRAGKR